MFRLREPRASFGLRGSMSTGLPPRSEAKAPPLPAVSRREETKKSQTRNVLTGSVVKMRSRAGRSLLQYHRTFRRPIDAHRFANPRLPRIIRFTILFQHRE